MRKNLLFITMLVFIGTSATAKEGMYLEFKMSGGKISGTSKSYSCNGNTRSETSFINPLMNSPMTTVSLMLKDAPDMMYTLNEQDKTYTERQTGKNDVRKGEEGEYEVTIVGKEQVDNYNCIHVKVRSGSSQHERDIWVSKDVAGWANYISIRNTYLSGSRLFDALKAKGAEGCIVRLTTEGTNGGQMQMDLVKAEKRDVDESIFSLAGYTKTASSMRPGGYGGVDAAQIQKMTPEERQKYIDDMKAKYQQQTH